MAFADLDSAAQLVEAGYRIALEEGLGAVSARTAAARAGAAASAVNYHFGDRAGFLRRIQAQALEEAAAGREALVAGLSRGPRWNSLADRLTLLVAERLEAGRLGFVLLGEFEIEAEVGGDVGLQAAAGQGGEAEFAFWREAALILGAVETDADGWAALAVGLLTLLHVEPDAGERLLWVVPALRRLGARLAKAPIEPVPPGPAPDEVLPEREHANETARRIVEAAIAGIAERGVSRLTHSPVEATARLRVVGIPSACIASLMMYSRSIGPSAARPSPPREYRVRPPPLSCRSTRRPSGVRCSPRRIARPSPRFVKWPNWWPA